MRLEWKTFWRTGCICLLLGLLTLAVYWPVRQNGFIDYDDQQYVTQNEHLRQGVTWGATRWALSSGYAANWHPLTWLSHMLDYQLFGLNPAGHHLVNLAFHILNAVLLLLVLEAMTGALWRSTFVAALFALHPLHVESVAWVAERKDVLSAFFGLLCLWAYIAYARADAQAGSVTALAHDQRVNRGGKNGGSTVKQPTRIPALRPTGRFWLYALAVLCFALALMSKPMVVTWPFVLLLLDYWPLGRLRMDSKMEALKFLLEKIPFLVLAAASSVVTLLVQQKAMLYHSQLGFGERVSNALIAYCRYIGRTFWPRDLAVIYPHPGHWPVMLVVGAGIMLLLVSAPVLRDWRTRPYLVVGWLWFLGMLVPVLGLVQVGVQAIADRYTYLPLIGIFLMATWGAAERLHSAGLRLRVTAAVLAFFALVSCALASRAQVQVWRDTGTLFSHAVQAMPRNWVAHYKLAVLALDQYQTTRRSAMTDQALLAPSALPARGGSDLIQDVITHCQGALEAGGWLAEIRVTFAKALTEAGRLTEARAQLETAVRLAPKDPEARQDLAEVCYRTGQTEEAVREYKAALVLRPDWAPVLNNLAWLLATHPDAATRNGAEAVRLSQRACQLTGFTNCWFVNTLAAAYAEDGDFTNAVATAEKACRLAAGSGEAGLTRTAAERLDLYKGGRPLRAP